MCLEGGEDAVSEEEIVHEHGGSQAGSEGLPSAFRPSLETPPSHDTASARQVSQHGYGVEQVEGGMARGGYEHGKAQNAHMVSRRAENTAQI